MTRLMHDGQATNRPPEDVPVFIDSVKTLRGFEMTRCNYLSIECDEPQPGWELDISGTRLPFLLLGLSGIVVRPPRGERFHTPEDIEHLFRLIEDEGGLLVDIEDVWIPNFLLGDEDPAPGSVYRMNARAFTAATQFREGRMDLEEFLGLCRELPDPLAWSGEETEAFLAWREEHMSHAVEEYPKSGELELHWEETERDDLR